MANQAQPGAGSTAPKKKKGGKAKAAAPKDKFTGAPVVNIQADYYFTSDENQALGLKLAGLVQTKEEIAAHKKDILAQLKAQEEACIAEIKATSNKRRSGFEVRPTEALVLFDPKKGVKHLHRQSDRSFIRTEQMLQSDYVQELPMEGLPPSQKPAAEPKTGKKGGKKSQPSEAGVTNFGDALKAAAAGTPLLAVPVVLDSLFTAGKIRMQFRKAAKKAKWPEAAIDLLDEEAIKAIDGIADETAQVTRTLEVLRPHTVAAEPENPEK